jgi:hypothetical protein
MNIGKQKKPTIVYKVDWIGQDPNFMFSKTFVSGQEALKLAEKNTESVAYKMVKSNKDTIQWQIIPTDGSKEMIRAVNLKRAINQKNGGLSNFMNADGVGEVATVTTSEYKQNQRSRLISTIAISGALIYAGTRKELQPWLRYTLIGLGSLNALFNIRNYNLNKNV